MRRLLDFVMNMDARAWRAVLVSFVLFGGVGLVFLFGAQVLGFDGEATRRALAGRGARPLGSAGRGGGLRRPGLRRRAAVRADRRRGGRVRAVARLRLQLDRHPGLVAGRLLARPRLRRPGCCAISAARASRASCDLVGKNGFLASLIVRLVPRRRSSSSTWPPA